MTLQKFFQGVFYWHIWRPQFWKARKTGPRALPSSVTAQLWFSSSLPSSVTAQPKGQKGLKTGSKSGFLGARSSRGDRWAQACLSALQPHRFSLNPDGSSQRQFQKRPREGSNSLSMPVFREREKWGRSAGSVPGLATQITSSKEATLRPSHRPTQELSSYWSVA